MADGLADGDAILLSSLAAAKEAERLRQQWERASRAVRKSANRTGRRHSFLYFFSAFLSLLIRSERRRVIKRFFRISWLSVFGSLFGCPLSSRQTHKKTHKAGEKNDKKKAQPTRQRCWRRGRRQKCSRPIGGGVHRIGFQPMTTASSGLPSGTNPLTNGRHYSFMVDAFDPLTWETSVCSIIGFPSSSSSSSFISCSISSFLVSAVLRCCTSTQPILLMTMDETVDDAATSSPSIRHRRPAGRPLHQWKAVKSAGCWFRLSPLYFFRPLSSPCSPFLGCFFFLRWA